jgi:hypothetical protein
LRSRHIRGRFAAVDHLVVSRAFALLTAGVSWKWLYVVAGSICVLLVGISLAVKYPTTMKAGDEPIDLKRTMTVDAEPTDLQP